jgi:hypothetical protein
MESNNTYIFSNHIELEITPPQVKLCQDSYNTSYGIWNSHGLCLGGHVKATMKKVMEQFLFESHACGIVMAIDLEQNHIRQAFYVKYLCHESKQAV